ncbi:Hypothetical protein R9X50_00110400 [Acrodontium crateriforme]|uniref:Uncharacterized protein n=1 Tax=Acrodontium crateriforme TaxID=150365 RepID=A0AAQ3LYF2_9PEZI|nr:Hypothetical protein R9X50_00110400 [Acrodontium crateriforme]
MPSLSSSHHSPLAAGEAHSTAAPPRPQLSKRNQSTNSTHTLNKGGITSPSSASEQAEHPLRRPVAKRHAKFALARGHGSRGNLAKVGRHAAQPHHHGEESRKHAKSRSTHEGDTEIRLPGSLDESRPPPPPPMRRNMTSYQLPRTTSYAKLKKNHSHGALTRLNPPKTMSNVSSGSQRTPLSPGIKGKNRRHRSDDLGPGAREKDLHEQEVELLQQQQERREPPKKVGFAVGSVGDDSDDDQPQMEGSGLQEDEWTEESNSASPYSTRQNTANNSRRQSLVEQPKAEKRGVKHPFANAYAIQEAAQRAKDAHEEAEADESAVQSDTDEDSPSPRSTGPIHHHKAPSEPPQVPNEPSAARQIQRAPPKEHANPTTRRILSHGANLPAPALVSQVSAMDDGHNSRDSPSASMRSSRSNVADGSIEQDQDLISRFIPSSHHNPSIGSATTSSMNTPKTGSFKHGSFYTPEEDSVLHRARPAGYHPTPVSPGSTVSAGSGAATPAVGRSRIELRMLGEKALADREAAAERAPHLPHHVYDRRNETLKSYLAGNNIVGDGRGLVSATSLSLGPETFQGRFKAINTELKVVQRFRDPILESVERMKTIKGSRVWLKYSVQKPVQPPNQGGGLKGNKSAVSLLPAALSGAAAAADRQQPHGISESPPDEFKGAAIQMPKRESGSKSVSPQKPAFGSTRSAIAMHRASSSMSTPTTTQQLARRPAARRGVSFAGTPPETRERRDVSTTEPMGDYTDGRGADFVARMLWEEVA